MSVGRNATYNLIGVGVPLLLALATVPAYLHLVGPDRYGVLAIAWLILGYFGLFDLGLGRATAQRIAALRDGDAGERATAFGTALATNVGIGLIGAAVLWPAAWYMFAHGLSLPANLRAETLPALPLLALAVPVATTMGVLSGGLMGRERFAESNRISVVSTALFQLVPLFVAWWYGPNLSGLLAASIAARLVGLAMLWRACAREFGAAAFRRFDRTQLRALLGYGGWVTLTAMFGPLLVIVDRFMIGMVLNATAVTIYTVPMQVTTRLSTIAGALSTALFPRLAAVDGGEARRLSRDATAALLAVLTPPVAVGLVLMEPVLRLWVGDTIGGPAAPIGRLLLIAAWLNAFAHVPYVQLQAKGRPDLVSKILMAQVPVYLLALYLALQRFGLEGAAVVFLVRVVVDYLLLCFVSDRRVDLGGVIAALTVGFALLEAVLRWVAPSTFVAFAAITLVAGAVAAAVSLRIAPPAIRAQVDAVLRMLRRGGARLLPGGLR